MRDLVLADTLARVVVRPDLGGGLAAYDWIGEGGTRPLLRRAPPGTQDPFALSLNLLIPWSGRVSGGGFTSNGRFHPLAANVPGEDLPLHGNAFQQGWSLLDHIPTRMVLSLRSDGPGPFRYDARLTYALAAGSLSVDIDVVNRAAEPLPYGVGFHPWFPRTPRTLLRAATLMAWWEDARHLPAGSAPIALQPDWDFSRARPLPVGWMNAWFTGRERTAEIVWPEHRLGLDIAASEVMSTCVIYSPGDRSGFFCFEPVSHPVDAHNLPGRPGIVELSPGDRLKAAVRFDPRMQRHAKRALSSTSLS